MTIKESKTTADTYDNWRTKFNYKNSRQDLQKVDYYYYYCCCWMYHDCLGY